MSPDQQFYAVMGFVAFVWLLLSVAVIVQPGPVKISRSAVVGVLKFLFDAVVLAAMLFVIVVAGTERIH